MMLALNRIFPGFPEKRSGFFDGVKAVVIELMNQRGGELEAIARDTANEGARQLRAAEAAESPLVQGFSATARIPCRIRMKVCG